MAPDITVVEEFLKSLGLFLLGLYFWTMFVVVIAQCVHAFAFRYHASVVAGILTLALVLCCIPISWEYTAVSSSILLLTFFVMKKARDDARLWTASENYPTLGRPISLMHFWKIR